MPQNYIHVLENDFSKLSRFIEEASFSSLFVLVDSNSYQHCLPTLLEKVPALKEANLLEIEPGESSKDLEIANGLWLALLENYADRDSLLINLGGGVVTDLGGFVASAYKRGIAYVHVPTTLLGMVDAAIGGKNGINLGGIKNSVGFFQEPEGVFIAPQFLETLPQREFNAGLAEVIKHGLVSDVSLFEKIGTNKFGPNTPLTPIIQQAIAIKVEIVLNDYHESGERKKLNFGHTIGHALEALFFGQENELLHGEAVALGMLCEAYLSKEILNLSEEALTQTQDVILSFFKPQNIPTESFEFLLSQIKNDKKSVDAKNKFVLLNSIGEATINHEVKESHILKSFEFLNQLCD